MNKQETWRKRISELLILVNNTVQFICWPIVKLGLNDTNLFVVGVHCDLFTNLRVP